MKTSLDEAWLVNEPYEWILSSVNLFSLIKTEVLLCQAQIYQLKPHEAQLRRVLGKRLHLGQ